jgi:hypothetical protein
VNPPPPPFSIASPNTANPCTAGNSTHGCINGFSYDLSLQYVAVDYVLRVGVDGTCDGAPYTLASDSCCYDPAQRSVYVVQNNAHACDCETFACAN